MHNCTSVLGKTVSMASGKPLSPSTQAMKMSCTPRFFSSVITCSQNLAPSVCATHKPRTSFKPLSFTPNRHIDRFVAHVRSIANFELQRIQIDKGVDFFQRAVLPGFDFIDDLIGDAGNQRWRDFHLVDLFQVLLDLAGGKAARVQRYDLVVKTGEARLMLLDYLRLKGPVPVPRHLDGQRPEVPL